MILKDKIMLWLYAAVLMFFGGIILGLLTALSTNVVGEGSWIIEQYPAFIAWFKQAVGTSVYSTLIVFLFGVILALMGFNIMKSLFARPPHYKTIAIHNPMGEIRIPLSAVEDFIQKCGIKVDGVRDVRSKIKARKKEVRVVSRIAVWAPGSVPDIADHVQEAIKKNMEELLGADTKIRVTVSVERICPRTTEKSVSINDESVTRPYPD